MTKVKKTALLYGEGGHEGSFFSRLVKRKSFIAQTSEWFVITDNASGGSPEEVLDKCEIRRSEGDFRVCICFVDKDKLVHDFRKTVEEKMQQLTDKHRGITIYWQTECEEDEIRRELNTKIRGKHRLHSIISKKIDLIINKGRSQYIITLLSRM